MGGPRVPTADPRGRYGLLSPSPERPLPNNADGPAMHAVRRAVRAGYMRHEDESDEDDAEPTDVREDAELRRQIELPLNKRRSAAAAHFMNALRRKRRMLARRENLRFRQLYQAPEPIAFLLAAFMVTVVSLILTKSWPFY